MRAEYDPPEGVSPAAARFLSVGWYDTRTFAAAILSLVAQNCVSLETRTGGQFVLSRIKGSKPKYADEQSLLRSLFPGRRALVIGEKAYVRLCYLRKRHKRFLEKRHTNGGASEGVLFMMLAGLLVVQSVMAVAYMGQQPPAVSAWEGLLPFWYVPVVMFGGAILGRWLWRREQSQETVQESGVAGYRLFVEKAMADRVNPYFVADGIHKTLDPAALYSVAFGFENAWADPFIESLENLLPNAVHGTSLDEITEVNTPHIDRSSRYGRDQEMPTLAGVIGFFWRRYGFKWKYDDFD